MGKLLDSGSLFLDAHFTIEAIECETIPSKHHFNQIQEAHKLRKDNSPEARILVAQPTWALMSILQD
jgi:hypothetical protein